MYVQKTFFRNPDVEYLGFWPMEQQVYPIHFKKYNSLLFPAK